MSRGLLFLFLICPLLSAAQEPCETAQDCCSIQCGEALACICNCLFDLGERLMLQENYAEAHQYLRAGQRMKMASGVCAEINFQQLMDSILSVYRIWRKEPGPGSKFAIANMRGELIERDQPYNPYRFSNPQPFRKGVAIYSENERYYFVTKNGQVLTGNGGYDGIIRMEEGAYYLIKKNHTHWEHSITSSSGLNPALWKFNDDSLPLVRQEFWPWKSVKGFSHFLQAVNNKYQVIYHFSEALAWVEQDNCLGIIDTVGNEILAPTCEYLSASPFRKGFSCVRKKDGWAIVSQEGKEQDLLQYDYQYIGNYVDSRALVIRNKKYGFINHGGVEVIKAIYDTASDFRCGLSRVSKGGFWGYIDHNGAEVIPLQYDTLSEIDENLVWYKKGDKIGYMSCGTCKDAHTSKNRKQILKVVKQGENYFFHGTQGQKLLDIPNGYYSVGALNNGLAVVMDASFRWGAINKFGQEIIKPQYDHMTDFHDGTARISIGSKYYFIDSTGRKLETPLSKYAEVGMFNDELASVSDGHYVGFIDKTGYEVIELEYDDVGIFSEKLARVKKDQVWGFIDNKGSMVIDPQFFDAKDFKEGLAGVKMGEFWGFINRMGDTIIDPIYSEVASFSEGLAGVRRGAKWGFIDKSGTVLIGFSFDYVHSFSEGLALMSEKNLYGIIDKQGTKISPAQYYAATDFYNGVAKVGKGLFQQELLAGYVGKDGVEIVPCTLDKSCLIAENKYLLYRSDKKGLLFADEKTYIPCEYEEIAQIHDDWIMVRQNKKWGWVDHQGRIMIPCRFDAATPFDEEGQATVLQFGLQFKINLRGEMIWL